MIDPIKSSKQIITEAISRFSPSAIVIMFSGGNDSLAAYHVAKNLDIPLTHFVHGVTGTGIKETKDFARQVGRQESGLHYIEADAGTAYFDYVQRKGFFGRGLIAHSYAYHILKAQPFRKVCAKIRKRRRNFNILLINGARSSESLNRKNNFKSTFNTDPAAKNNIWVNLIHDWEKKDCSDFLSENSIKRNPVSELLCRSGECLCGTMQSDEERKEASLWFPDWGNWIDNLEKSVCKKFPWKWGVEINKYHLRELRGQQKMDLFQPACTSCLKKPQLSSS